MEADLPAGRNPSSQTVVTNKEPPARLPSAGRLGHTPPRWELSREQGKAVKPA